MVILVFKCDLKIYLFTYVNLFSQEREARIESKKKMERSSIVFAFGSSTPRMLEPTDSGSTYWASRRYVVCLCYHHLLIYA